MFSSAMANERARQKRLERKRRKREEKRRALRTEADPAEWGLAPMSLTLKRFAEPLLDRLPDEASAEDWKLVLTFAAMVWNATEEGLSEHVLALGREVFESLGWQVDAADEVRRLRASKASHFQWEQRRVAGVEVEDRGDTMHVLALSVIA
jgi:hypothetical protein